MVTREDISLARRLLIDGREIVPSLNKGQKTITELTEDINMPREIVCYRMSRLEDADIIQRNYKIVKEPTATSPGIIKWFYKINRGKLDEALQAVENVISFYRGLLQT